MNFAENLLESKSFDKDKKMVKKGGPFENKLAIHLARPPPKTQVKHNPQRGKNIVAIETPI